nr:immunoglobulin heavy chain junction region [Homo sapiens]MBN4585079.1 immunoglobulin heavy chain junction region [Homo sapiens]
PESRGHGRVLLC